MTRTVGRMLTSQETEEAGAAASEGETQQMLGVLNMDTSFLPFLKEEAADGDECAAEAVRRHEASL